MTVVRKNLWFEIPPMKGEETPYQKPTVDQATFELQFRDSPKNPTFDPKIDEYWNSILNEGNSIKFTSVFDRVRECESPGVLMAAYSPTFQSEDPLSLDLLQLITRYNKILPTNSISAYLSSMKLSIEEFGKELPPVNSALFHSVIELTHAVMSVVHDYTLQKEVISKTASSLVPYNIWSDAEKRNYVSTVLTLPMRKDGDQIVWLIMERDRSIHILSLTQIPLHDCKLEDVNLNLDQFRLEFRSKFSLVFVSKESISIWKNAVSDTEDPMFTFVRCLSEMAPYKESIPQQALEQLEKIATADDFDFTRAFTNQAASSGTAGREASKELLFSISNSGNITALIRMLFGIEIRNTKSETNIYRENSASCVLYATLSEHFGQSFLDSTLDNVLESGNASVEKCVKSLNSVIPLVPQQIKFITDCGFRAARRKFPDQLTPLKAISALFMLRFILPKLSTISQQAISKGKELIKAFVFYKGAEFSLDDELYREIAELNLKLVQYGNASFSVEKMPFNKLFDFCKITNMDDVVEKMANKPAEHPIYWSILTLVENAFIGDEDLLTLLSTHSLFE